MPTEASTTGQSQTLPADVVLVNFQTGEKIKFTKFLGKVILINFWASWCEACMAEMPSIEKLYEQFKGQGLEIVAINVDDAPEKVVPQIVKSLHLTFPVYTDPQAALQPMFNVVAIPFSLVADKKQKVLWSDSGERDWATPGVIEDFRKLLKKI